ncbi:MAG: DUF1987 domain-containing protein [Bacteroidales bacterium]|nr:DUF1987 domain-containing protein [Bacteroidales bacterium]
MDDIHIKAVRGIYIAPAVDFSTATGECTLEGESFLEETSNFYSPLLDWLNDFVETGKPISLNIKLTYFNTSTSKWILNILHTLKFYSDKGGKVQVNWYYLHDDIDMSEEIDDYIIDSGIDINKIVIE